MSGGSLAYQLRPNKAIDRNLFIELLNKLNRVVNISDYTYFGFGGPFLEDFKAMHAHLRIGKMVSIEADKDVFQRQQFNSPIGCIGFLHQTSGEFLESESFDEPSIVWLDYTEPSQIGNQLKEINYLVTKLSSGDILKVTVNCNPSALGTNPRGAQKDLQEFRLEVLESRLNEYFPSDTKPEMLVPNKFGRVMFKAIELAIKRGMDGKRKDYFQLLSSFTYKDGQQMLTLTGIILDDNTEKVEEFFKNTRLRNWPSILLDWVEPKRINVPELSAKERIYIDNMLPNKTTDEIKSELGFSIDGNETDMKALIESYKNYYRQYPLFSRVIL